MREQIKELCLFMICGQTLLYFQSGKKYEKICRMILELLVLAGIVGMILNFLQSFGIQKGEMQAWGGAVAGMQRSMEEALERQLDMEGPGEDLMSGISMESLVEKYTMEEIRSQYSYYAEQYGYEIEKVQQRDDKLQIFLKVKSVQGQDIDETDSDTVNSIKDEEGFPAEIADVEGIQAVEIERIEWGESAGSVEGVDADAEAEKDTDISTKEGRDTEENGKASRSDEEQLETFRRQLALVFAMEEEKLEVILID